MNLAWAINRLRSMSAAEIVHRVTERAHKIAAKNRLEGWDRFQNPGAPPILPQLAAHVKSLDAGKREAVAAAVRETLEGRFSALGRDWPVRAPSDLFPPDLWRLDPVTGKLWPGAEHYCFDIAYRHVKDFGDIKYVWEINRLQFLQPLAAQVFLEGDDAALAAIESCIESWHRAYPPFRGLGWNSGIEVSLRAITLLIVTSLCGDRLKPDTIAKMRAILTASLFWLGRFPSRFSSANNHLIAEAAGEYLISLAMPELPHASKIRAQTRRTLEDETQKQFHSDGVPAEQSPTYGAFSAEFIWFCNLCAPLAASTTERLKAFTEYVFWLADEKGRVPAIGDDDEGRVLAFYPRREDYCMDVAAAICAPERKFGVHVFREGGYSVVRNGRWHVVFDHGPLGYLSIAAHGHADALAACITLDGEPLLVDPGTYLYHSGGEERDWFRGTAAHNTLNIDRQNQSSISGPFNWSHKAQTRLLKFVGGSDWLISAEHEGYEKRFHARHERTIASQGGDILITDRLLGRPHSAELVLQFALGLDLQLEGAHWQIIRAGREVARVTTEATGTTTFQYAEISPTFGVKASAPRLCWRGTVGSEGVATLIQRS